MNRLHFLAPEIAAAPLLADLLARRRVGVTTGGAASATGATMIVSAAGSAAQERVAMDAARLAGARIVVLVQEDADRFSVTSDLGGRLLRMSLPRATGPALSDPVLLLAAEHLAAPLQPMVACDPVTGGLLDMAARVARSDVTVLISGPTGTGKEVLARTIHQASRRADKPFVAINCAAIPENMLEAILFGHEKGAYTGAATANKGLIRAADGGTLLLDEISEMPLGLQAKLLRVLQERRVTPLGATADVEVDIRIIATSNRDMRAEAEAGRFREDLYYRLNVFPLATRALQDRPEDIAALATAMLRRHGGQAMPMFDRSALAALAAHDWPGNVRELENVVQRALVLCDGQTIGEDDIILDIRPPAMVPPAAISALSPRVLAHAI